MNKQLQNDFFRFQRMFILSFFFCTLSFFKSQISVGENTKPAPGTLLDLSGGAYQHKGLGLPRVKLESSTALYPMFTTEADTLNAVYKLEHEGLVVYNTNQCSLLGSGIYVWEGNKWSNISPTFLRNILVEQDYIDLPSGADLRPLIAQPLKVMNNYNDKLYYTYTNKLNGGVVFSGSNVLPRSPLSSSSSTISLLPSAMVVNPASPWQSRETLVSFTDPVCVNKMAKMVTLNQTNYAIKVNGSFANSWAIFMNDDLAKIPVQGNATWKVEKDLSNPKNILVAKSPLFGNTFGRDIKDGTTEVTNFEYSVNDLEKYVFSDVLFKDPAASKRYEDIKVSVMNCRLDKNDYTLEEWALRAGFTDSEINSVVDAQAGSSAIKNGYQLHRDQDGNLLISSDFGPAGRWMVVNMAAKSYSKVDRTGDDKTVYQSLEYTPTGEKSLIMELWTYPNYPNGSGQSFFLNNRRMGLLYNWRAVVNHRSYPNPIVDEGEKAATPSIDPQTAKIQGICPNGWHVPSDWEWTNLEQELSSHASQYSVLEDITTPVLVGENKSFRGTHASVMKDFCPAPGSTIDPIGRSNLVTSLSKKGGFAVINASNMINHGSVASFWTSSIQTASYAYGRILNVKGGTGVTRGNMYIDGFSSVRCKKDN